MVTISELLAHDGPFATVVLRTPSATEDARSELDRRWQAARRSLQTQGIDEKHLSRLDEVVANIEHSDGPAIALVQTPESDAFVEVLDDDVVEDLVVLDSLPRLGPVLESRQRTVPHVVVVADRAGADIVAIDGRDDDVVEVEGDTEHLHRGHPGGWSQRRFQQRAENQWESNAADVADKVAEVANQIAARVICVGGDVRAVGFLHEHLPDDVDALTHDLEAGDEDGIAEETVRAVADVVARDTRAALERFGDAKGAEQAADGADETVAALTLGRVQTLLVHDDPDDERRGRYEFDGIWCSASADDTTGLTPGHESDEGRLVDVIIRSALHSEAEVRFVPRHGGPDAAIGAILRW